MKKLIFAFVVSASIFSAFSFTTAANEEQPDFSSWTKIPTGTKCTTNDGQPGSLTGCQWANGEMCPPGTPKFPKCLPNG